MPDFDDKATQRIPDLISQIGRQAWPTKSSLPMSHSQTSSLNIATSGTAKSTNYSFRQCVKYVEDSIEGMNIRKSYHLLGGNLVVEIQSVHSPSAVHCSCMQFEFASCQHQLAFHAPQPTPHYYYQPNDL